MRMKRVTIIMIASLFAMGTTAVAQPDPTPAKNGNKYIPYENGQAMSLLSISRATSAQKDLSMRMNRSVRTSKDIPE